MSSPANQIVGEQFRHALVELIECYSSEAAELTAIEAPSPVNTFVATIGFGDEQIRGSVVIFAEQSTIDVLTEANSVVASDWIGELSNQLAGRFKNKLSVYGLLPQLGTPVILSGSKLDLDSRNGDLVLWNASWTNGNLDVALTLQIDESLELTEDASSAVAEEGSLSLF